MLGLGNSLVQDYKTMFLDDFSIGFDGTDDFIELTDTGIVDVINKTQGAVCWWAKVNEMSSTGAFWAFRTVSYTHLTLPMTPYV